MSADNGIYYAKFRDWYRVVHWFAVDNLAFYKEWTLWFLDTLKEFFWYWTVYKTIDQVRKRAEEMEKEAWWTEYWICYVWDYSKYDITKEIEVIDSFDLEKIWFEQDWNSYKFEVDENYYVKAMNLWEDESIYYYYELVNKENDQWLQLNIRSKIHLIEILNSLCSRQIW